MLSKDKTLDPIVNRLEDAIKTMIVHDEGVSAAFRGFATFVRQEAGRTVTDDELLSFLAYWIVTNPANEMILGKEQIAANPTQQQIVSFFETLHQAQE